MSKVERFTKEYFGEKKHHHRAAVKINDVMAEIDVKLYMIKRDDVVMMIRSRVADQYSKRHLRWSAIKDKVMVKDMIDHTQKQLSNNAFGYLKKSGKDSYSRQAVMMIDGEEWIHPHIALTALQQYSVELSSEILEFLTMEKFFKEKEEATSSYVELAILMREHYRQQGYTWEEANKVKDNTLARGNIVINEAIGVRSRRMPDISVEVHKVAERFFAILVTVFEDEKNITNDDMEMAKKLSGYKRIIHRYRKIEQGESEEMYYQ